MAYLELTRWINILITFAVVLLGGFFAGLEISDIRIILAAASASLIAAGGNAINDYFDIEVDKVNKPFRPLPAKKLTPEKALLFWFMTGLAGIILAFQINLISVLIALSAVFLLYVYSFREKNRVLTGNLIVSLLGGFAFIYAGAAAGKYTGVLIPAIFAFLFHFGREIIKDMQDLTADKKRDAVTFAIKYGKKISLLFAGIIFMILIVSTIIPYYYLSYSKTYLIIVLFGVDFIVICAYILLVINCSEKNLRRVSALLKADILIGLLALLFR